MRRFLIVLFACCLAGPTRLSAQTADDYVKRESASANKGERDKAIADYTKALAIDPKNVNSYINRGAVWHAKGEHDKAIADYTKALAIDPKNVNAYINRGSAWHAKGEDDKAIVDYTKALAIDPKNVNAYISRGAVWHAKVKYGEAIADYTKAVAIAPKAHRAYLNLAFIHATCPDAKFRDGKKSVENASKADELTGGKDPAVLHTLAAAYAESGDFAKAQEWQEKAIELAPEEWKKELRARLELYKQGKPYHEPPMKK
jgi:tetratricopeptide (TPR) repeat protein